MTCKKHPKYRAIRKPRVQCYDCWLMYTAKLGAEEIRKEIDKEILAKIYEATSKSS